MPRVIRGQLGGVSGQVVNPGEAPQRVSADQQDYAASVARRNSLPPLSLAPPPPQCKPEIGDCPEWHCRQNCCDFRELPFAPIGAERMPSPMPRPTSARKATALWARRRRERKACQEQPRTRNDLETDALQTAVPFVTAPYVPRFPLISTGVCASRRTQRKAGTE